MHDAHLHLADPVFAEQQFDLVANLSESGWQALVVNGTSESDWTQVYQLAKTAPDIVRPSYGLHPWHVKARSSQWLEKFESLVRGNPGAGVGECGLDRWIKDHDLDDQLKVLKPQIDLATELNRPLTLHCLKAWGALITVLSQSEIPKRGFLVHACSASEEVAFQLLELGAYFSYSTYFVHERKQSVRELYANLPLDRLLVETDAPSMAPPTELSRSPLSDKSINHPANLTVALESLHDLREEPTQVVSNQLKENFETFFAV